MTLAGLIARAGCRVIRALVAMQPRDFRRSFGAAVVDDTIADIHASVPSGAAATAAIAAGAIADATRGLVAERASSLNAFRRAMQNAFVADLRYALRTLARDRGFTAVAVGTLSVGLALCATVAVLVNAYLVRGLPYPDSQRLFDVRYGAPGLPAPQGMEALDWRALGDVLELEIAWDLDNFSLRGGPYPELAQGTWVTPGYMEGYRVTPALGRRFEPADFETGRPNVAIISHGLWQRRFNGDASILGRTFEAYVNDRPNEVETFTVVGILPATHWHVNPFTEVLAPLRAKTFPYVVRLRPGVPPDVVADRITALIRSSHPSLAAGWRVELVSTHANYVRQIRPLLLAVATATGLVLLISYANVGVLLTVRATRRRREIAVRQAIGATAGQITRAIMAEPLVLGGAATALGLGLAWATLAAIGPSVDHYLGRGVPGGVHGFGLDARVMLATLAAGLVAIAVCSVVPLIVARRTPVSLALTGGQKGATEGPVQRRARATMVAIEIAACLTLLVGAGLTIQSAVKILQVEMGLDARNVHVSRFSLRQRAYPDAAARTAFYDRVLARSGEIDGVDGIAFTNSWPLQPGLARDVSLDSNEAVASRAEMVGVSPDYFDVLRIPLEHGRAFTTSDRVGSERVVIVSRTLAARLWPAQSPIGQHLRVAVPANAPPSTRPATLLVVGVAGDIRHAHTDGDLADAYVPLLQSPSPGVFVYMRASGDSLTAERSLRTLLASIDGDVGLGASRPLAEILDLQRAGSRLLAWLLVVFAIFAAGLALVGIYGVIAYTVRQAEREIAVRLAIGADRRAITRMFVVQGSRVLAFGLALGCAGAVGLAQVLQAQLFDMPGLDPTVIAVTTVAFALCGLVAIAWPAHSAASLDPATALKD